MEKTKDILVAARCYAINCHESTNHTYDNHPYSFHLQMVVEVAKSFLYLIPAEDQGTVLAACWCHDVIEDCRQTYSGVAQVTSREVADIVYAVTNEKGRNRNERANARYYEGIRNTRYATFVKLCDRIANVKYSLEAENYMLALYTKENQEFLNELYDPRYNQMAAYLLDLLADEQ